MKKKIILLVIAISIIPLFSVAQSEQTQLIDAPYVYDDTDSMRSIYVPVLYDAGLLAPASNHEIRMLQANTNIDLGTNKTQEEYVFKNESAQNQDIEMEIRSDNDFGNRFIENLNVQVEGANVSTFEKKKQRAANIKNIDHYFGWKVNFEKGETKKIAVTYNFNLNGDINTICYGISNSRGWKDRIDKVTVSIDMGNISPVELDKIVPEKNFNISGNKLIFEYNNFEPKKTEDDISILLNMGKAFKFNYSKDYKNTAFLKLYTEGDIGVDGVLENKRRPPKQYDDYMPLDTFTNQWGTFKPKEKEQIEKAEKELNSKQANQAESVLMKIFNDWESSAYARKLACYDLLKYYKSKNNVNKIKEIYKSEVFNEDYYSLGYIAEWAYADIAPKSILDSEQILKGKVIYIDPAHQEYANNDLELISPNGTRKTVKNTVGEYLKSQYEDIGINDKYHEYALNLEFASTLKKQLTAQGAKVVMARNCNDVNISNIERAENANKANADLVIKIHSNDYCNYKYDDQAHGIKLYYPSSESVGTKDIVPLSKMAALDIIQGVSNAVYSMGWGQEYSENRGSSASGEIASFNWSDCPAVYIETGFLEDPFFGSLDGPDPMPEYRKNLFKGIVNGVKSYFSSKEAKEYYSNRKLKAVNSIEKEDYPSKHTNKKSEKSAKVIIIFVVILCVLGIVVFIWLKHRDLKK